MPQAYFWTEDEQDAECKNKYYQRIVFDLFKNLSLKVNPLGVTWLS